LDVSKHLKKYQEALIACAIRRAFPTRTSDVYWNESFGEYFVDPDVTFGADRLAPEAILCVAHSDSEKESDKKFWRNAGELVLAKCRLGSRPLVVSIVFEPHYKPALLKAMASAFDYQVSLIADVNAPHLVNVGPSLVTGPLRRWTNKNDIIDFIETTLVRKSPYREEFRRLSLTLKTLLGHSHKRNKAYWASQAAMLPAPSRVDSLSFESTGALRRGISKLLCVPPADRQSFFHAARSARLGVLPAFVFGLGWAQKTIKKNHGRIKDDDLRQLAAAFDWTVIDATIANIPIDVLNGLERIGCQPCRDLGQDLAAYADYFINHTVAFTDERKLAQLLRIGFDEPKRILSSAGDRRWLLDFGLAAGKAIKDRAQGYGLSQLARELTCDGPDRVRFWIPDYNSGRKPLPAVAAKLIAKTMAEKFALLLTKTGSAEAAAASIAKWMGHTLVEVKLCTYRLFKPAELLVRHTAISAGHSVISARLDTCDQFTRGSAGLGTDGLVLQKGSTQIFFKVQSGAKNTHDKAKELSGRIGLSLKRHTSGFIKRFETSVLVLDGPFKESEARMCYAAGWDYVVPLEAVNRDFLATL
jgi:hypothetical protein